MLSIIVISKLRRYRTSWSIEMSPIMTRSVHDHSKSASSNQMTLAQAFIPYLVLTGVTLFVLLIEPIKSYLEQFRFGFAFPLTQTGYGYTNIATAAYSPIAPLTNAGLFLLLSAVIGFTYYRSKGWIQSGWGTKLLVRSIRKTIPSAIAILGFVVMSRIMSGTGQTVVLAYGIAAVLGQTYMVLAPLIGMLGAFMTSSNMASNILFSEFQMTTATLMKLNTALILGAQTAGGAIGGTISPGNIIMGATTAGVIGQEGKILRRVLPIALSMALFIGIIMLASQWF
jgi:lactate permease